jgi:hypothetical protein
MKKISVLIIFMALSIAYLPAQDFISIVGKSPYPAGTKVFFEGYEGFQKVDLGSIPISDNGNLDYFTDYHGYCVMSAERKESFPLILENDPTCIEWDSIPSFPCDQENAFYYKMAPSKVTIDSLIFRWFASHDSLQKVSWKNEIEQSITAFRIILSGESLKAGILLEAELLMLEAQVIEEREGMAAHKVTITNFVNSNYEVLIHSNTLINLAVAYTDMNKRMFLSPVSMKQANIYDVGEWLNMLGPLLGEKSVVDFFIIHFAMSGESEIASDLVGKYNDIVKCDQYVSSNTRPGNIPYTFSIFGGPDLKRVFNLDQFHGIDKILALYSTDCPASVAAVVGLYAFMSDNQLRLPVILVPEGEPEGEYADLIKKEAPFGMQTGMKTGNGIIIGAGIKQLPAFIILDERSILKEIHYDINELKSKISGN